MKKALLVFRTEIINTITRPSFIIITFGVPIISFLLVLAFTNASDVNQRSITNLFTPPQNMDQLGYVDQGGLIKIIPEDLEENGVRFESYPNEEAAAKDLEDGKIAHYYVIPVDFYQSGEYFVITPDFNPLSRIENNWAIEWLLTVNLLDGDTELAAQMLDPMVETRISLSPDHRQVDEDNPLTFAVPYVVTLFFYIEIFGTASLMMNSVSKEKQNRVIEVLLMSVSPRQLLTGKILALGLVGIVQTGIYISIGSILLRMSGRSFAAAANFNLPPDLVFWGLIYFLLGFLIYATLMAGAGALASSPQEASQITYVLIIPMVVTMFFMTALIQEPNSPLSVLISLFPFSTPVAMMTRLAAGNVPLWQLLLSIVIMAVTAVTVMILVARLFRAQNLLTGQEVKVGMYVKVLLGRG